MDKFRSSILLGVACIVILLWGIFLGYTLTPPKLVRELVHVSEQVHLSYFIDQPLIINLGFTVQRSMTFEVQINNTVSHTLNIFDNVLGRYSYSDFTTFNMTLDPIESSYYFFDHSFDDDVSCLVEYFLYGGS